jgi:hypothetical protein
MGHQVARLPDHDGSGAAAFGAAWGYDVVVEGSNSRLEALRLRDHERRGFDLASEEARRDLERWARPSPGGTATGRAGAAHTNEDE